MTQFKKFSKNFIRENSEYDANLQMEPTQKSVKKFRLKDKKSGLTKGVFSDIQSANKAHECHPDKNKLMVEEFLLEVKTFKAPRTEVKNANEKSRLSDDEKDEEDYLDQMKDASSTFHYKPKSSKKNDSEIQMDEELINGLRIAYAGIDTLDTKSYTCEQIVNNLLDMPENLHEIAESDIRFLSDLAQFIIDKVEMNEGTFDWKNNKSEINFGGSKSRRGTYGSPSYMGSDDTDTDVKETKKSRGRPAGSFNKTKKLSRTPEQKKEISDKIWASRRAQPKNESMELDESKLNKYEAKHILDKCGGEGRDFYTLHSDHVSALVDASKKAEFRKSKNAKGSTARMFHDHLNRISSK